MGGSAIVKPRIAVFTGPTATIAPTLAAFDAAINFQEANFQEESPTE